MNQHTLPSGVQVIERGWLSANMIVATGRYNTAVIDSGYCTHADQTCQLVQDALQGKLLERLLNTHLHSDHCGGNTALQAAYPKLKTYIPPGEAESVSAWDVARLSYRPTGQECPAFTFNELLVPGSEIELGEHIWQIHAALGHDPHSIILFEPATRTLVSADALWENGFGVVFPEIEGYDAFNAVGATLDLIATLRPTTVIPGHGPVFHYSNAVIDRARQRLQAFIANPYKHARHAAKVLLKFKLLTVREIEIENFRNWARETHYLEILRSRFSPNMRPNQWINGLIADLCASGAAHQVDSRVMN